MYLHALDRLTQAGYEHYEVSNFALPGHRSLHNQVYWRCEPYFGFGPGAARYVDERRELNHRSTATWFHRVKAGRSPSQESESLDEEQRARERLVFGLRMLDGIDVAQFESESRRTLASLAGASISRFIEQGMLERHEGRLRLTRNGLLVSDSLWPDLI
jgi:oxygen-independent coproporphyrinogen-3 oxidase